MIREEHQTVYRIDTAQAARGLAALDKSLDRASGGALRADGAIDQLEGGLRRVPGATSGAAASSAALQKEFKKLTGRAKGLEDQLESAARQIRETQEELRKLRDRSGKPVSSDAISLINRYAAAYLGLRQVVALTRRGLEELRLSAGASLELESIQRAARVTRADLGFLKEEADRLGVSFKGAAQQFGSLNISFRQAGLGAKEAQEAITAVSEAGVVLSLSQERQQLAFQAINQIAAKNVVSMEELRQQLAEQIPGALGFMAEGLGVTTAKLQEMVSNGEVLAKVMKTVVDHGNKLVGIITVDDVIDKLLKTVEPPVS